MKVFLWNISSLLIKAPNVDSALRQSTSQAGVMKSFIPQLPSDFFSYAATYFSEISEILIAYSLRARFKKKGTRCTKTR